MRWIIICIVLLMTGIATRAQETMVSGWVRTTDNRPIENATVVGRNRSGYTVAFTKTNTEGSFHFLIKTTKADSLQVCALMVGFAEQCAPLPETKDNLVFVLQRQQVDLEEVIVKKIIPAVTVSGDTTRYNLKTLTDGKEAKLEDILKKLPGIRVDDAGTVTFKGKKISKILVEGEDFFSKDYKLLSKNLSAALVEKVEAIENYNEEELLRDIEPKDESVLNIGLNKKKIAVFGDVSAGMGSQGSQLVSADLFSFISRFKLGLISNTNSIGRDIKPDLQEQIQSSDAVSQTIYTNSDRELPIHHLNELSTNSISERYMQSEPSVHSLQFNTKVGPAAFRSNTTYKTSWLEQQKKSQTIFSDGITTQSFGDSGSYSASPVSLHSEMYFDYRIDSSSKLKTQWMYGNNNIRTNANLSSAIQSFTFPSFFEKRDRGHLFSGKITYLKRFANKAAFRLTYAQVNNSIEQALAANSDRYNVFLNVPGTDNTIQQHATIETKDHLLQVQYLRVLGKHRLSAIFTANYSTHHLLSAMAYQSNPTGKITTLDSLPFRSNLSNTYQSYSMEWKDHVKWKRLFVEGTLHWYTHAGRINNEYTGAPDVWNKTGVFPSALIGYKLNAASKLALGFSQYNQFSSITDYSNAFILTDITNFSTHSSYYYTNKRTDYILKYQYNGLFDKGLMFAGSLTRSEQQHPWVNRFTLLGTTNLVTTSAGTKPVHSTLLNLQLDQVVPFLKSRIGLTANLLQAINYDNPQVPHFKQNDLLNAQGVVTIQTGLKGAVNFNFNAGYNSNAVTVRQDDNQVYRKFSTANLHMGYRMSLAFSKSAFVVFNVDRVQWMGAMHTTAYFSDLRFNVTTQNKQWSFEMYWRNLFNSSQLYFNQSQVSYTTTQEIRLLPRMGFVSVNYRL